MHTDIFAGATLEPSYLARNPVGRTPMLETESGECIAESNAILLYLAEGTPFLPDDPIERARVHGWMFFEQNLLEPNIGSARFWKLTGRDAARREAFADRLAAGVRALETLDHHLDGKAFLVGERYSAADISVFAYSHIADGAGVDLARFPSLAAWFSRVRAQPGFMDDIEPYPASAQAGAGGDTVHDQAATPAS